MAKYVWVLGREKGRAGPIRSQATQSCSFSRKSSFSISRTNKCLEELGLEVSSEEGSDQLGKL